MKKVSASLSPQFDQACWAPLSEWHLMGERGEPAAGASADFTLTLKRGCVLLRLAQEELCAPVMSCYLHPNCNSR